MLMTEDPRKLIDERPMSPLQIAVVAITTALNGLDGFDIISISFAAPGIAAEWGVNPAALGIVLSMELMGMLAGSLILGGLADKFGRRPLVLTCLVLMTVGMAMASTVASLMELAIWRVLTGLGIGGMVAALTTVAAEFSNAKRRNLSVSLIAIGYATGAVVGGSVAAYLLQSFDWRAVFQFGAIVSGLFIPIVWMVLPESVGYLTEKQPANALARLNRTLARMRLPQLATLPAPASVGSTARLGFLELFSPGLAATTILLTIAYFGQISTFYFILKWTAMLVADRGFHPSAAAGVLVWANVGGILASIGFGLVAQKIDVKGLTIALMAGSFLSVTYFNSAPTDLTQLTIAAFVTGMFLNSAVAGLFAIIAQAFPTHLRATGIGLSVGIGRGGAIFSPILAGMLLQAGHGPNVVALVLALGSLLGAVALFCHKDRPSPAAAG